MHRQSRLRQRERSRKIQQCRDSRTSSGCQVRRDNRQISPLGRSQQGVVIIIALFIVALVAGMSYVMMARLERDTIRTSLLLRNTQAGLLAQGSIYWAIDQLKNNLSQQKPNQLTDKIPIKSPVNEQDGFKVQSTIYDMQALYNLNNLTKPDAQKNFIRLIQTVQPKISTEQATGIAKAVTDWVSTAKDTSYDKYYEDLPYPYRAAHRLMQSESELALVKGMTPALYQAIQPYVIALPNATMINVQTAAEPVLMTLDPAMTTDIANAIITVREANPIVSATQFSSIDQVKNHNISADNMVTSSNYFLVVTTVAIEKQKLVLYTLLERFGAADKPTVTILMQSKGIW